MWRGSMLSLVYMPHIRYSLIHALYCIIEGSNVLWFGFEMSCLSQLRQECSLAELMDHESCMVKQIRSLDSDMQTLVYENYNKFISATG